MDNKRGNEGSFAPIFIMMAVSLVIAFFWDSLAFIRDFAHSILDPTVGALLDWHLLGGMTLTVLVIAFFMTLVQKYATDQKTLKEMKAEQKKLQQEMKEVRDHPEKLMELQKESMKFMGPMMKLSMRGIVYTAIPLILLFRWFNDYFVAAGNPKFFGFMTWLWFYLIFSIIFSSIIRKQMDVA